MGMTTVLITHNAVIAEVADRVIRMKNGRVSEMSINENPKQADEIVW
jgi:putative ABC transport system ATP-binding protein